MRVKKGDANLCTGGESWTGLRNTADQDCWHPPQRAAAFFHLLSRSVFYKFSGIRRRPGLYAFGRGDGYPVHLRQRAVLGTAVQRACLFSAGMRRRQKLSMSLICGRKAMVL